MADFNLFLDELRNRIPLSQVISKKVKLSRKGKDWTGLCPFHNEKTPSFIVNEHKGFYHCFGCGAHGDIITFEMKANNLPFIEAVEKLANEAGLQVPRANPEDKEKREKRTSSFEVMELAAKYFHKQLSLVKGQNALNYLMNRGIKQDTIAKFKLGYAPSGSNLKAHLNSKNINENSLLELGLISENDKKKRYDFFRDRVIIPIMDKQGRVIAFGGRVLDDSLPKYLNSPDTPIFNKRRILYNLSNAREAGYSRKQLIVCEGYMDVIALDMAGYENAVAPLGTALTEEQIGELWKIVDDPILSFDGDKAGVRAAMRSIDRVLPILQPGKTLKFVFLPDKLDPDEFLKERGKEEFEKLLQNAKPLADIIWMKNQEGNYLKTPEQKAKLEQDIMNDIARIENKTVQGYYQREMNNRVWQNLKMNKNCKAKSKFGSNNRVQQSVQKIVRPDLKEDNILLYDIIAQLIYCPKLVSKYEENLLSLNVKSGELKELLSLIVEITSESDGVENKELIAILKKGHNKLLNIVYPKVEIAYKQRLEEFMVDGEIEKKINIMRIEDLDLEIKECLDIIKGSDSVEKNVSERYFALKKEKESLLNDVNDDF